MMLAWPVAAQPETTEVTLNFTAMVGDEPAQCGETYPGIGTDEAEISFNDFRLYVSNVKLVTADGDAVAVAIDQDTPWQHQGVILLDFEDGTASCSEVGNAALNGQVTGIVPLGDYAGVQFDMGVPFELNHADVIAASSPLNIAAMWWNWQGGYKFMRADLMTDGAETPAYNIHLGSTGCASPAGVVSPTEACAQPNITTITLTDFDFETDVIVADLGELLADVSLHDNTPMPPGCMAGRDDPDCPAVYAGFGLSLEAGVCAAGGPVCESQTFFRVASVDAVTLIERTDLMPMEMNMGGEGHGGHGG